MFKKLINILLLLPLAIILIIMSVANRQSVTLALNPFNPEDAFLSFSAPFFVFVFASIIVGVMLGSIATWASQGKHRKKARREANSAAKWHTEADKLREQSALEKNTALLASNANQ